MNITLDDGSPQIGYYCPQPVKGCWFQNHTGDPQVTEYFRETFMGTKNDGDYMTLRFNGTAVYVYGSKRFNHGAYSAQLDNGNVALLSGYSRDSAHQSLLYSAGGLATDREHFLTMTNLPSQTSPAGNETIDWWLDIDYVIVTAAATGQITTTTIDDSSPMVTYTGDSWKDTIVPANAPRYYNATTHATTNRGDSLTLSFTGSSVQLFGALNFDHGNYTVAVDGLNYPMAYNGSWYRMSSRQSLFFTSGLPEGPHTVTLRNGVNNRYGNYLDFDYAVVNSTAGSVTGGNPGNSTGTTETTTPAIGGGGNTNNNNNPTSGQNGGSTSGGTGSSNPGSNTGGSTSGGSNTGGSASNASANETSSKSSAGPIAGGVVGGLVALLAIGFAVFWFLRKRKRAASTSTYDRAPLDLNGEEVKPYVDPNSPISPVSVVLYDPGSSSGNSAGPASQAPRSFGGNNLAPPVLNIPPPPPSNVTSYPLSAYTAGSDSGSPTTGGSGSGRHPYENPFGSMSAASDSFLMSRGTPSAPASNQSASSSAGDYFGRAETPQSAPRSGLAYASDRPQSQLELDIKRADGGGGGGGVQPFTARSASQWSLTTSSATSPETARTTSSRMQVHGREVDLGPLPEHDLLEHAPMSPLPPNYEQATEPIGSRSPAPARDEH